MLPQSQVPRLMLRVSATALLAVSGCRAPSPPETPVGDPVVNAPISASVPAEDRRRPPGQPTERRAPADDQPDNDQDDHETPPPSCPPDADEDAPLDLKNYNCGEHMEVVDAQDGHAELGCGLGLRLRQRTPRGGRRFAAHNHRDGGEVCGTPGERMR